MKTIHYQVTDIFSKWFTLSQIVYDNIGIKK